MALPDAFQWTTQWASRTDVPPSVIQCNGAWVVTLYRPVDSGIWMAALDRHRHGSGGPARICSSYDQGRAGAEIWVARNEVQLRAEVGEIKRRRYAVRANRLCNDDTYTPLSWPG